MALHEELYNIITSLEKITGIGVCFYGLTRFFSYNYGNLKKQYTGHYCEFCKAVRELPGGRDACIKNDVILVKELARSYKKPFFNVCHIGLCECVVPVLRDNELLGILFIGQCRVESETNFAAIREKIIKNQGAPDYFEKLYTALPSASRELLSSAGKLAEFSLKSLVKSGSLDVGSDPGDLVDLAKQYIASNYMNPVTLASVSRRFHIHPVYLSRKFKEKEGVNFSDYILNTRIEHAKSFLACTNIPIAHIALNVGFTNQNYFARMFKRVTACTPQSFRKIERS